GRRDYEPRRRRQAGDAGRHKCRRALRDGCRRAAVVGISARKRCRDQIRVVQLGGAAAHVARSSAAQRGGGRPDSCAIKEGGGVTEGGKDNQASAGGDGKAPYRARLPGFTAGEDVGLGDVIKRATSFLGIRPCGGCEKRAAALNRRVVFTQRAR